jgi:SAM-dependent methyltransferase
VGCCAARWLSLSKAILSMDYSVECPENEALQSSQPQIAWNWSDAQYQPSWHEPLFEVMSRYVSRHSRILEVGAGGSHTLGAVANRLECQAFGIEPDCDGIFTARRLSVQEGASISMIRGDGFALPFADNSFDFVYSLGLIEHFDQTRSAKLINEHVRVCKPQGRVLVSVPNWFNLPHTIRKWFLGRKYPYYPERSYTSSSLCTAMTAAGLHIVATDGMSPLWGVAMMPGGWKVTAAIERLGLNGFFGNQESSAINALLGYMTFAIGRK